MLKCDENCIGIYDSFILYLILSRVYGSCKIGKWECDSVLRELVKEPC